MANNEEQGRQLINAVDRILASDEEIIKLVTDARMANSQKDNETAEDYLARLADKIISLYSIKSAISGGATAIPAIIPGAGTLVTIVGGALADAAFVLKFEVEMVLALSNLYGFDIRQHDERQLAFLLASVNTYEAKSGKSFFVDMAKTEGTAIWNYAPREVSKLLLTAATKVALLSVSKSFAKALPFVGITVGAGMNKVLTAKVGHQSAKELAKRRKSHQANNKDEVIDATYEEVK